MLNALIKHFERCVDEKGNPLSLDTQRVPVMNIIICDRNGKPVNVIPVEKPGKFVNVPIQVKRANSVISNFLVDNLEYVLGLANGELNKKSQLRAEAFREKNRKLCSLSNKSSTAEAFEKFLDIPISEFETFYSIHKDKFTESGWTLLQIEEMLLTEDSFLMDSAAALNANDETARKMISLISGKEEPIAKLHPAIKNLFKGQSAGTNLISFNEDSTKMNGTGEEQGYLSPVGIQDASRISQTLSYLLRNNNNRVDMINILSFSNACQAAEEVVNGLLGDVQFDDSIVKAEDNPLEAMEDEGEDATKEVTSIVYQIKHGIMPAIPEGKYKTEEPFYIIGLQPNASRISTLFFYRDSFYNLLENFRKFYAAAAIDTGNLKFKLNLYGLIRAHKTKTSKTTEIIRKTESAFVQAMIFGRPLPRAFYQEVLERVEKRGVVDAKDKMLDSSLEASQMSFIKAFLILNDKTGKYSKELTMSLNEQCKSTPYLLGRIFAACVWAEQTDNQTSMRFKLQRKASNNPAAVYPHILEMTMIRVRNNKGLATNTEKLIGEIMDLYEDQTFPAVLHPEEQGAWWLGYYQQRQDLFKKAEAKKAEREKQQGTDVKAEGEEK